MCTAVKHDLSGSLVVSDQDTGFTGCKTFVPHGKANNFDANKLISHLKVHHETKYSEYQKVAELAKSNRTKPTMSNHSVESPFYSSGLNAKENMTKVKTFIALVNKPCSIVEDVNVCHLLHMLCFSQLEILFTCCFS